MVNPFSLYESEIFQSTGFFMSRLFLLGFTCLALSACGTAIDGASQRIEVVTPGANDAVCTLENNNLKYKIYTPGAAVIPKRPGTLTVSCVADGNRQKTVVYDEKLNDTTYANVLNAGLGAAWDYETGGAFEYPEKIVVDFTGIPTSPMPKPNYDKHLSEHPELFGMEEFRPGRSALIRDKYETPYELQKREVLPGDDGAPSISGFTNSDANSGEATTLIGDDIGTTSSSSSPAPSSSSQSRSSGSSSDAESLTRTMNPSIFGPSQSAAPSSGSFAGGTTTNTDGR